MQTSPDTRLTFREKAGYALGDVASNFFFQISIYFITFFYTDIFGLAPAAVGTMFLIVRIWDAINDPMMGALADRTDTRWGKFRPYLLWGALPFGLFFATMFTTPDLSVAGKLVFAYVTYTAMLMAYTVVNVPYSALMGVMTSDGEERTRLSSYRFVGAFAAGMIVQYFTLPLAFFLGDGHAALERASARLDPVVREVAALVADSPSPADAAVRNAFATWAGLPPAATAGTFSQHLTAAQTIEHTLAGLHASSASADNPVTIASILPADLVNRAHAESTSVLAALRRHRADGFQWAMSVFAAFGTAFFIVAFFASRERVAALPGAKPSFKADLSSLRLNRPWQIISLVTLVILTAVVIRGGATLYFFKYSLGAESAISRFFLVNSIVGILGAIAAPHLTRWFGKRRTLLWVFATGAAAAALTFLVRPGDWTALYALSLVVSLGGGIQSVMTWAIFADTADYGEHRTGVRNTGLIFASTLFAIKTGITLGGATIGWYLAAIHFVPDTLPSESTALGIRVLFTLVPAGLTAVCLGLMFAYPLHERDLTRINRELAARRVAAPAA